MTRPNPLHHADHVAALLDGRALVTLPIVRVQLRGDDVLPYLQTKLTADTRAWEQSGGSRSVATDINGRIVADASWHRTDDGAVALVPAHPTDPDPHPLVAHLERYVIMEDVEVAATRDDALYLVGDATGAAPELPATRRLAPWRGGLLAARTLIAGRSAVVFLGPAAERQQLADELAGDARSTSPVPVEALSTAEVLSASPRLHEDLFAGETIPLEAGLWEAVSFNKGCYLGQEVIERLFSRGRPNKRLCLLRWEGEPVPPRHALVAQGRESGFITRSAAMDDGTTVALGYVRRRALDGGLALALEGSETPVERLSVVGGETPTSSEEGPW